MIAMRENDDARRPSIGNGADAWATARFSAFAQISEHGLNELKALAGPMRYLREGEFLRHEGDPDPKMYLLCSGWTASSIVVAGGSRQMVKVHMPGDLLGLPSLALASAADSVSALTPAAVITVERSAIGHLFEINPRLAGLLFLISQEERVMLMDRLASVGRTDAVGRIAALILQLHDQVLRNDPDAGDTFHAPLKQSDLADLAGLTKVHVNRTLQKLRADKIVRWANKSVTILDGAALKRLAGLPARTLATDLSWLPAAR